MQDISVRSPSTSNAPPQQAGGREPHFLALGGLPPAVAGLSCHTDIGAPFSGIVLIGKVTPSELDAALAAAPDPALPIADFGDNRGLRRDFASARLDQAAALELHQRCVPIWRRLAEFPFPPSRDDRAELTALRIAYSRESPIEAVLAADTPLMVDYPILGREAGVRTRLETLAQHELLRRRHFTRTHACRKCASSRLHAYEACPNCGGGLLKDESIVHHYRCGWQEPESRFVNGRLLICPKCRRELRHFGVDYGKPGRLVVCQGCGTANAEPVPQFACLDCGTVTPAADAAATDWYHYDLAEEGVRALRAGRLPRLEVGAFLEGRTRAFPPRDFLLLVSEGLRVAQRYRRPFAVGRLSVANVEALRGEYGLSDIDGAFRLMVDVLIESLRDSDFVGADGCTAILIGFPETTAENAGIALKRMRKAIRAAVAVPFELVTSCVEGGEAFELLAQSEQLLDLP